MTVINNSNINYQYWNLTTNVPESIRKKVEFKLLPFDHPAREKLNELFEHDASALNNRVSFQEGGFQELEMEDQGPGRILVGSHPELDTCGVIIKAIPTSESEEYKTSTQVQRKSFIKRSVIRVDSHIAGQRIIEENNLTRLSVSKNWLYPLPGDCSFEREKDISSWKKCVRLFFFCVSTTPTQYPYSQKEKIYAERFIVVEELIEFDSKSQEEQMKECCDEELLDQVATFLEHLGYADAHQGNWVIVNGNLVFIDLEFFDAHSSDEKRLRAALYGMQMFGRSVPKEYQEYWKEKVQALRSKIDSFRNSQLID